MRRGTEDDPMRGVLNAGARVGLVPRVYLHEIHTGGTKTGLIQTVLFLSLKIPDGGAWMPFWSW